MRYAQGTAVSTEKSRAEIEGVLRRYGTEQFGYMTDETKAVIGFKAHNRLLRFVLPLPSPSEKRFERTPAGRRVLGPDARYAAWEQACRQRWRALALVIKAKLEAVESGISEFESEFLAHIILPSGQTMGEWARPQIAEAYAGSKKMPALLS